MIRKRPLLLGGFAALAASWYGGEKLIWFTSRTIGEPEWRVAIAADSVPRSIAEAEAFGARFPHLTADSAFPPAVLAMHAPGTSDRRCVPVGDSTDVHTRSVDAARSGEFFAAPFSNYAKQWRDNWNPPGKVSWIGAYRARPGKHQLIVRFARIDSASPAYVHKGAIRHVGRGHKFPYGMGDAAYFTLPSTGTWLIVATMGAQWGCFVFALR